MTENELRNEINAVIDRVNRSPDLLRAMEREIRELMTRCLKAESELRVYHGYYGHGLQEELARKSQRL